MDAYESGTNGKRKHEHKTAETTSKPMPKSQRPNTPPPVQPMKITDLDDVCLEKIFGHLDMYNLFNVAVSNEWLRPAAQFIYKRKFGTKMVCLTAIENCAYSRSKLFDVGCISIVSGLKISLQFLRCIGPSISILAIIYRNSGDKWSECIHQYVNKYCTESLTILVLCEKTSIPIKNVEKPFVNVQNVVVINSDLGNQFASFPQWFPNLNTLEFHNVRMYDRSIEMPFNHLQRLAIDVNNGTLRNGFTKREAAHLLHLCPTIDSLEIRIPAGRQGMTLNTLIKIIKNNQTIRELVVPMEKYWSIVKLSEIQHFVSEHPTMSVIWFENYKFTADTVAALIWQLNGLKQLKFQIKNSMEYNEFASQLDEHWKSTLYIDSSGRHFVELIRQH